MSKEKPGLIRRTFGFFGKLFGWLRSLINLLFFFILIMVLVDIFGQEVKPLPEKTLLTLVPSGILVEQRSYADPLTQLMGQSSPYDNETPIRDLIDAVDFAASDSRITGLVMDLNHLQGGGISKIQEIGAAITRFKESGKPVVAISDSYDQQQYLLASYADEIHLNPMGGVMITGFGAYGTYLKEATEKLKINVHVFRVGEFKSAVEPFTRNDMSPAARENTQGWVSSLWRSYTDTIEQHRKLTTGALDNYVATLPQALVPLQGNLAQLALNSGLVDQLSTGPQLAAYLKKLSPAEDTDDEALGHKQYLTHTRLLSTKQDSTAGKIGLIVASGTILDGEQPDGNIGGDSLAQLLKTAQKDNSLKGLVLRIDSPGGSAFASEVIRQQILEIKTRMPVVVSMGSTAASGGYWIAANADEIWATPTTITGSIGVFGIIPTFEESLASLGIHSDGVGTSELADINHLDRPLSDAAGQVIQLSVNHIYGEFLELVAEGRGSTPEAVDSIAQGRVWTGEQAKARGLVDALGNLDAAIASAATRSGLTTWQVQPITKPLSFQEQLLKQLAGTTARISSKLADDSNHLNNNVKGILKRVLKPVLDLRQLNDPRDIYLSCFDCLSL